MGLELVKPHHLRRRAVIYVRQSTPQQVLSNQESLRLQYALQHRAREFGWHEADIDVIDSDLGMSGAAADHRQGFKDLVPRCISQRTRADERIDRPDPQVRCCTYSPIFATRY